MQAKKLIPVVALVAMMVVALAMPLTAFGAVVGGGSLGDGGTATLSGTVTDPDTGSPIVGAIVTVHKDYWVNDQQLGGSAVTDENGRYTLTWPDFHAGGMLTLIVKDPSGVYCDTSIEFNAIDVVYYDKELDVQPAPADDSLDGVEFADVDEATGIGVITFDPGVLPGGTELVVTPLPSGSDYDKAKIAIGSANAMWVYDISLLSDGVQIQPDGTIYIAIPVPAGYDGSRCWVYRIEADGTATDMHAQVSEGYLVFATNHLSTYAVGYWARSSSSSSSSSSTSSPVKQTGVDTTAQVIGGLCLLAAMGAAFAVARRKGLTGR